MFSFLTRSRDKTPDTPEIRVRRGAEFLDHLDTWWFEKISPSSLAMGDDCHCVLGQKYNGYGRAIQILNMSRSEAVYWGFHAESGSDVGSYDQYDRLTAQWKQEIIKRREEVTGMNIGEEQPAIVVEPIDVPDEVPAPDEVPVVVPDEELTPA